MPRKSRSFPDGTEPGHKNANKNRSLGVEPKFGLGLLEQDNQALSGLLFQSAPDANILVDERGTILELNRRAEEVFGYTRGELMGQPIENLLPERFCEEHVAHRVDYLEDPQPRAMGTGMELFARRRDGSEFPVEVMLNPLPTNHGTLVLSVIRDLSPQKHSEASLQTSEARFHAIFDKAAVGIQLLNHEGWIVETNPAMQAMLGYTASELQGMSFVDFTYAGDARRNLSLFQALVNQEILHYRLEKRYQRKDRSLFWGRLNASRYEESPEQPPFVVVMVEDISELKQAGRALLQSEERFRKSLETLLDGFAIFKAVRNPKGKIVDFRYEYINEAGCRLNQRSKEEQIGHTLLELLPAHLESGLFDQYVRLVETGEPLTIESLHYADDFGGGERLYRIFDVKAVRLGDGLAVTWEDITERKQMETELGEVQRKLLSQAEEERLHLARELHDGPIQELYGLSFQLNELKNRLGEGVDRELASEAIANLQNSISTLRAMMSALRPPSLAPFGLEKTIRSHAQAFQHQHPELRLGLDLAQDGQRMPELTRLGLYRIYQEALNNILRHANARNVFISLKIDEKSVELSIQDDGVGFEVPRHWVSLARRGHYGLVGMRERAEAMAGKFEIVSSPGQGTLYRVVVPVED